MILTAYDRFGRQVARQQATVTSAGTDLAVRAAEIMAFTLEAPYGTNAGPPLVRAIEFDDAETSSTDAAVAGEEKVKVTSLSDLASAPPSPSTLPSTSTTTTTTTRWEWMLWALGALLLIALGYFLWRSR